MSSDQSPKWREDFPFEFEFDEHVTRRDFTRFLVLVSGGFATGTGVVAARALTYEEPPAPRVAITTAAELGPGTSKQFRYPDAHTPALLVRRLDGSLAAFQQRCPHLGCPVRYHRTEDFAEALICHCHNGRFDLESGEGTSGPPRELRPLRGIILDESGGQIFAVGLAPRKES
jgi:nitrite reductase/ring-hydroxylating ferredoxin subunit